MKPKIIKAFENIDSVLYDLIRERFPTGFENYLIAFTEKEGKYSKALPLETDEYSYLIKINPGSKLSSENNISDEEEDLWAASQEIANLTDKDHLENENKDFGGGISFEEE